MSETKQYTLKELKKKLTQLQRYSVEGGIGYNEGLTYEEKDEFVNYVLWEDLEKIIKESIE